MQTYLQYPDTHLQREQQLVALKETSRCVLVDSIGVVLVERLDTL